ncbi:MAG: sterol desaturase family protein [Acidimicrobiales bacterium]|nr:sterol desaturase family protein [Hyphomonadaceae bacterium]RZV41174.1 MAG: sterol desaturase family protein [Acidimicrobiales bacterium]
MTDFFVEYESQLRLGIFVGVLLTMMTLEFLFPRKKRSKTRLRRWTTNLLIILVDNVVIRLVFPIVAVGTALLATTKSWGIFNLIDLPVVLEIILAMIILDLLIYAQHIVFHMVPAFWNIHKVHHADRDIDVTTGIRFHPIEMVLSLLYKMICIVLLGAPVAAVLLFELILNACSMFNHSNVKIPLGFERSLRFFIVTPDMHRVHHSVIKRETNSNYGFSISLWDRLFGTYRDQPSEGHDDMTIGVAEYQNDGPTSFTWSLLLPFGKRFDKTKHWL